MRKVTFLLGITLVLFAFTVTPRASSDLITCPYPGVGTYARADVLIFNGQGFYCDFPREGNGSHWHCEQGSGGAGFNLGAGGPLGEGNGTAGGNFGFGLSLWTCSWRCPDNKFSKPPNPPGKWRDFIPEDIKCTHLYPEDDAPLVEPPAEEEQQTGAVTNPVNPNPLATVNGQR